MTRKHTEARLEDAIEDCLLQHNYAQGQSKDFDVEAALEPVRVIAFIKATQEEMWQKLHATHGEKTEALLIDCLVKELDTKGMLKVLRHGFKMRGKKFRVANFAPANNKNPQSRIMYAKNCLSVTRQLYYSGQNKKSLDMVLFLNGLPVVTLELKNPLSGQTVEDAKRQYKEDRNHRERLFEFKKRTLVHFAVDQDLVFMTTKLCGKRTTFLPFNRGSNPNSSECGAGNPLAADGGYKTTYLWREVLAPDSLMDILGRFMHLQTETSYTGKEKKRKKINKETMIFPRYHQLDVVRSLIKHSREKGSGHNYLIQHSAGSGKSNSIAWLAHRLSNLHDAQDNKIFNSVIVVTDRRVLDQQLQNTICQFEHKCGVVQKIDEDTRQLVKALANGTHIIITTLQKFPFVTETIDKLNKESGNDNAIVLTTQGKRFAVIVDEAHSSQSGESAMQLKGVLNKEGIRKAAIAHVTDNVSDNDHSDEEDPDCMELIAEEMIKRGKQPNISFFAFTATPKYKTLQIFDEPGCDGKAPFHQYTMRQAIEEKFILDVLKNYTTYKTYFRLAQSAKDDSHVEHKKAALALARFVELHPHNLAQKTEVMVQHFHTHVKHKIGGRAKAMVVTGSRLHAVRYKQAFDKYLNEHSYKDIKSLVAFSGSVEDPDVPGTNWTEVMMNNGIKESELPEKFDSCEYQILLVAEKYQTGFDQPQLHTMYVDKKLSGIKAVQTLSRLNRTCAGKEDTFILDFRNESEDIFSAFKPFYDQTPAEELTDAQHLYRLQHQLDESGIIFVEEIQAFCNVYFKPHRRETKLDHAEMNGILDKAVERYNQLPEDEQDDFKGLCVNFKNMYSFLSQVIPYQDSDLEQLYTYLRFLLTKLPRRASSTAYQLEDEVELEYYRLQKISEGSIDLKEGEADALKGPSDVGTGRYHDKQIQLSELIDILNKKFGTSFTQADQLFFDQIPEEAIGNNELQQAARVNSIDDFKCVFDKTFDNLVIGRMEDNEEIFNRLMSDDEFKKQALEYLLRKTYKTINEEEND